ncbi:MAG: hypothetical protein HFH53_07505 [Hespellia sp.]|jgi:phosphotriesterase-related protein|nr:hypothetical protein [Hespellia sp.]
MKIRTVCGDIASEQLGYTLVHEHVIPDLYPLFDGFGMDIKTMRKTHPALKDLPDERFKTKLENVKFLESGGWQYDKFELSSDGDDYIDFMAKELEIYKAAGGKSICEVSYKGCTKRTVADLKTLSERTGVNIICCTGLANASAKSRPEAYLGKTEDELTAMFEEEVVNGADGTDIKPGILKALMTCTEERDHLRALARVSAKHDLPLHIHVQHPMTIDDIVDVCHMCLDEYKVNPHRLLINHIQQYFMTPMMIADYIKTGKREVTVDGVERVLATGANITIDCLGNKANNNNEIFGSMGTDDYLIIRGLMMLLEKGHASRIMLGHDYAGKQCSVQHGSWGYTRIPNFVGPMLWQLGFEKEVEQMTVKNPVEHLAFVKE